MTVEDTPDPPRRPRRRLLRRPSVVLLTLAALLIASLRFSPSPIDPAPWTPAPDPGRSGPFQPTRLPRGIAILPQIGPGPEAIAATDDGWLYTGLQDGRIRRIRPDGSGIETLVQTGGRPLGMKVDSRGHLIVADAFRGLLSITPGGKMTVLANEVGGTPMRFVNDIAIARDGRIWFSDSSTRFDQHHWMFDFWEARPTGRLLCYDPAARTTSVILDGLLFPNGVALDPNGQFVLVAETLAARITRHWLRGPKAGQTESFVPSLPGYPDNLAFDEAGTLWVALPRPRVAALELMAGAPSLRRILFHIPAAIRDPKLSRTAWIVRLDAGGRVLSSLQDSSGAFGPVTSILPRHDRLYLGSIGTEAIGWIPTP